MTTEHMIDGRRYFMVDGKLYRELDLPAADVHEAKRHLHAQRPTCPQEQAAYRETGR